MGSRDPGTVESAARSFEDVLPRLAPLTDQVVDARLNPDALAERALGIAAEAMPAVYADEDPRNSDAHLARTFLSSLIKNTYRHLLAQPVFVDTLVPQLWNSLLESIDDLHGDVRQVDRKLDRIDAKVEELSARTDNAEARASLERQVVLLKDKHRDDREAVANLLGVLLERHVHPTQWETSLIEAEEKALELQQRISRISPDGPSEVINDLTRQAERATAVRDLSRTERLLEQIRELRREARFLAAADEAEATADIAAARAANLDHRGAAELYSDAASVPGLSHEQQWRWHTRQAEILRDLGEHYGDNEALVEAIDLYRNTVLALVQRGQNPDDRAAARNDLGVALCISGDRSGNIADVEEAIAMHREALDFCPRERTPLVWATVMNDLGIALAVYGRAKPSSAHLHEAATAYRAALEVRTAERTPTKWAVTQTNLGGALSELALNEGDVSLLHEIVESHRSVVESHARESNPLAWAMAQNNLGNALAAVAVLETGNTCLEEAVEAYREALTVWTRERGPIQLGRRSKQSRVRPRHARRECIRNRATGRGHECTGRRYGSLVAGAHTDCLGIGPEQPRNNLRSLGERLADSALLKRAIATLRSALGIPAWQRAPLGWARNHSNLGRALAALGKEERDSAHFEEAFAAFLTALEILSVGGCVKPRINGEQWSPLRAITGAGDDSERRVGV